MEFVDRVSAAPNRYLLTPPEGGDPYYVLLDRADEPTVVGTPLNAETFNAAFGEKAPAGYGLGGYARPITNPDNAIESSFCALAGDSSTGYFPEFMNFAYGTMLVENRYNTLVKQTFYFNGIVAIRYGSRAKTSEPWVWTPLEFVNPPMITRDSKGNINPVEYRTAERFEGKPVYVKRIPATYDDNISTVGSGTIIRFPHGISNFGNVVRCQAVMDASYPLPHISHQQNGKASIISVNYVDSTDIAVAAINISRTAPSFVFDIAYCKA